MTPPFVVVVVVAPRAHLQVDRVLERVSGTALWQHPRRRSGRRKRPDTGTIPRQAGLFPRLGDMLGERRRRASLPCLATERHPRCQRRVVHRVKSSRCLFINPLFPSILTHVAVCGSASKEEHSQKRHKIVKNGYNLGRDWFVERALAGSLWKGHGIWWRAKVEWRTGLLEPGNLGAPYELAPTRLSSNLSLT